MNIIVNNISKSGKYYKVNIQLCFSKNFTPARPWRPWPALVPCSHLMTSSLFCNLSTKMLHSPFKSWCLWPLLKKILILVYNQYSNFIDTYFLIKMKMSNLCHCNCLYYKHRNTSQLISHTHERFNNAENSLRNCLSVDYFNMLRNFKESIINTYA